MLVAGWGRTSKLLDPTGDTRSFHPGGDSIVRISLRRSSENYISPSGKYLTLRGNSISPSLLLQLILTILVQTIGSYWHDHTEPRTRRNPIYNDPNNKV